MKVRTSEYRAPKGWSAPLPASLDGPQTLVLAFGAWSLRADPTPFADLRAAFPRSVIAGCSTAGEIAGATVHDGTVSLAVAEFDRTPLRLAHTPVADAADSSAAGERLAGMLQGDDLRAVFILSHGVNVNGTELVHSLAGNLAASVQISGGLAGDDAKFENTWVIVDGVPKSGVIAAVGFYGEAITVGVGVDGGWNDFGPDRLITKSEGHVLLELDGKPALDLYRQYLGEFAKDLPGSGLLFPLSIRRPGDKAPALVRTLLGIDEARRAMTFGGDMPEGATARLMRTTNEQLVNSAVVAIGRATRRLPADHPALVVSVSCVGRRLLLGERTDEEVETIYEGSPAGSAHVGFYSNGEIASGVDGSPAELHNQTITVTTFGER
ncbi:MAG: FIST C-terminal domain-containing protein [Gemmatimonadetes bacterium]|nr:FIST C-terminal domain-containing protein [Gemmatimonadota bacterium]